MERKGIEDPKRERERRVGISSDRCLMRGPLKESIIERSFWGEKVDSWPARERM
jgi:hypothetical protein